MTRGIASVLLLLYFLTIGLVGKPATWPETVRKVKESVVFIAATEVTVVHPESGEHTKVRPVCTGFVIDRLRGLLATAAHCVGFDGLTADGKSVEIVYSDPELDVAILESEAARRKPELRERFFGVPEIMQNVVAIGYGYDMGQVIARFGHIEEPGSVWKGSSWKDERHPWITTDFAFIKGMSGGPLVDIEGRVLGIIVQSDVFSGWARPVSFVYQKIGPLPFPRALP